VERRASREAAGAGRKWANYAFPMLEVGNSGMIAASGEGQVATYPEVRHFRIVTLHTVDILATAEPGAEWVS
jgi:hypothetical protein